MTRLGTKLERIGTTIYVPAPSSYLRSTIARGAGIVGTQQEDGRVLIDYEGAIYNQTGMETHEARVYHAYDRHTWGEHGYPTVARAFVPATELVEVGSWDPVMRRATISDQLALDEWLFGSAGS